MAGPHPFSFRSLVLPREHGSWSLALEPVALGLLVAPTVAGGWLALAVLAGFFTRRPLKLAWTLPTSDPRRAAAARWTMILAGLALTALWLAAGDPATSTLISIDPQGSGFASLWPLLLAAPFGAAFLWFDLRGGMREAEAEVCGSGAFALVPAAFATLAGWTAAPSLALAALMLARSVPTVLVVRAYLRTQKGQPPARAAAWLSAILALAGTFGLAKIGLVPPATIQVAAFLFLRSTWLLGPLQPAWPAKRIGLLEAVVGLGLLATLTFFYRAGTS